MQKLQIPGGIVSSTASNQEVRRALAEIAKSSVARGSSDRRSHPFAARMPLSIARALVERLSGPGAVVLDPLAGSGTTVLAAKELGRIGVGFDIDPLAVMLSQASAAEVDPKSLRLAHARVLARAERRSRVALRRLADAIGHDENEFLHYWFPRRSQKELAALAEAIRAEKDRTTTNVLWVLFSTLVVSKSAGASYALDLAHTRPHRNLEKEIAWPLKAWESRFERLAAGLSSQPLVQTQGRATTCRGDARKLPLRHDSVELILTSPPYLRSDREAIDYLRAHKFSLVWMGYPLARLRDLRGSAIASQRGLYSPDGLPSRIENKLIEPIRFGSRKAKVRRYLSDLYAAFCEMRRVLKPGALAVVVLGPSIVSRARRDAADVIRRLGRDAGLIMVASVNRRLSDRHRALPPPRLVSGTNSLRKRMRSETFVALRKPTS